MASETWQSGGLDPASRSRKLLFGQMYEDVAIETAVFVSGSRVFSIASAGDTALALSARHEVTAVDSNPVQLRYAQQRAAGSPRRDGTVERTLRLGRRLLKTGRMAPAYGGVISRAR